MAAMDIESFKEILKARGLKVTTYIGSKEAIENRSLKMDSIRKEQKDI
ncbi:MAG: hypothetical protein O8C58_00405 [Candidatus Methanoperedens sp.]|nr:hypothetical protein [Candidatus Methanoperedens sp.]MCZ7397200.1 hypothetical protein [Candidatus Methanoperedens sp.]